METFNNGSRLPDTSRLIPGLTSLFEDSASILPETVMRIGSLVDRGRWDREALRSELSASGLELIGLPGTGLDALPESGDLLIECALAEGTLGTVSRIERQDQFGHPQWMLQPLSLTGRSRPAKRRLRLRRAGRQSVLPPQALLVRARKADYLPRMRSRAPVVGEAGIPGILGEAVVCTPASVPDPDRKALHPTVLMGSSVRRSHNASVGRAQELLNRFLGAIGLSGVASVCSNPSPSTTTFITSGLTTLTARSQNPLVVDCRFGPSTKLATQMLQRCVNIKPDGVIGTKTWAFLELMATRPRPSFVSRPCCILAPDSTFTPNNILDPSALGTHGTGTEANGHIYCGKAGFFDLGHARDMIDLVRFIHDQLTASGGPPQIIRTLLGIVSIRRTPANPIETAASIAFDDAMGHEITSWDTLTPGGRNSSFSPEDLVSNFLGTVVGSRAIAAMAASGGSFQANATAEINKMVTSLDGQVKAESEAAFNLVNGRWVNFSSAISLSSPDYLLRRNFTRNPFKAGHSSDAATPAFVTAAFPASVKNDYDYFHLEGGKVLAGFDFPGATARVRREAKAIFGNDFDKPN